MSAKKYEVEVLSRYCKGCGLCIEVCEVRKLCINPRPNRQGIQVAVVASEVDCTGCLKCATICPDAAVEVHRLIERAPATSAK